MTAPHVAHCEPHGVPLYICRTCQPTEMSAPVDEEPWTWTYRQDKLARSRSRDIVVACAAGLVILAIAAWWVSRP